MRIISIHLRRFRGLKQASLEDCAGLNVLIGKNNSGKSSVMEAVEIALAHFSRGAIASRWETKNSPHDEFTNRDISKPLQIGLTFELREDVKKKLIKKILDSGKGLDSTVKKLESSTIASVIIAAKMVDDEAIIFIQEAGFGSIDFDSSNLSIKENHLLLVQEAVAEELAGRERKIAKLRRDVQQIDANDRGFIHYAIRDDPDSSRMRRIIESRLGIGLYSKILEKLDLNESKNLSEEKVDSIFEEIKTFCNDEINNIESSPLENSIQAFSGNVNSVPEYAKLLIHELAQDKVLNFKEVRDSVGKEEAYKILELKTRRGGGEAFTRVQKTVKSLLGVRIDAFLPKNTSFNEYRSQLNSAEMDVDDFLVEANGAGIREALRIILDLELKSPSLALIEEPEVHLHPGLEKILHGYLVEKSKNIQIFVATHSTNFLDVSSRQNIYLLSRNGQKISELKRVSFEEGLLDIPECIGLKPSTVLMFDQLVFVEGPSDEDILTIFSKKLGLDLTSSNTTFVQMHGASNFSHYANKSTMNILSRRKVKMWFVLDKDEFDENDLEKISKILEGNAELLVLKRRELENYLISPKAIHKVITGKLSFSNDKPEPSLDEVKTLIDRKVSKLLDRTLDLRLSKAILGPCHPKSGSGSLKERLIRVQNDIASRLEKVDNIEKEMRAALQKIWSDEASILAPGSEILKDIFSDFGCRYQKRRDGQLLAECLDLTEIDEEIANFLRKIYSRAPN